MPNALKEFYDDSDKLDSFREFSKLDSQESEQLLIRTDTHPYIDISDHIFDELGRPVFGKFNPGEPNRIMINKQLILRFNMDHENEKARKFILAVTLHECVHYGRKKKNELPTDTFQEFGEKFEQTVWGKVHGVGDLWFDINLFHRTGVLAFLDFIAEYESKGNYNARFGSTSNTTNPNFTSMSINGVLEWQAGQDKSACGKYQIIKDTLSHLGSVDVLR